MITDSYKQVKEKFLNVVEPNYTADVRQVFDEPTYLGFKILFHFNDPMSPLLNISDNEEHSALSFLKRYGYKEKEFYLRNFINELQYVSKNSEWFFQSLEGVEALWDFDIQKEKVRDERDISINTLESIDLRITKILDYYYKACFDETNRREIIPANLRIFAMSIYIADVREFEHTFYDYNGDNQQTMEIDPESRDYKPSLFFRLEGCEIVKTSRTNVLSTVSNIAFDQAVNKIQLRIYGNVMSYSDYVLSTLVNENDDIKNNPTTSNPNSFVSIKENLNSNTDTGDSPNKKNTLKNDKKNAFVGKMKQSFDNSVAGEVFNQFKLDNLKKTGESIKNKLQDFGEKALLNSIDDLNKMANGKIKPLVLGNVYEDSVSSARTIRDVLNNGLSVNKLFG